ncbi:MAG: molecular chaperone DnaJ [Thaumarchaeota archaeon]|nr:molecular chaperone DnaJ [Nitrososphaerota archaeon]|tara:strand:- start:2833 stop:3540 length:708 start_codon:yes stop_codon:yes gene_type:complete
MNRTQAIQILMLDSDASFDDIKYAYRKLSLELHPDRNKNESDGRRFKSVLEAYHFLKSQSRLKNSHYDDKTVKKKTRPYQNRTEQNPPEEDWSKFTKDFEMDENFWRQYEKSFWEDYEFRKNKSKKNDYGKAFWDVNEETIGPRPKTKNQKNETKIYKHNLSVRVDKSQCIACMSCETIAPNVFVIDKLTMINPKSQVHNQYGASEERIMDAAETCPTKAIKINERKSGRKVYPL